MMLFSGNANPELVTEIAGWLNLRQGKAIVGRFSDGEVMAEIQESVRGRDTYVIQSTSQPTNDNLMELLVMIDALRWSSAKRITAVIPYFGYARQDRKDAGRVPITALGPSMMSRLHALRKPMRKSPWGWLSSSLRLNGVIMCL